MRRYIKKNILLRLENITKIIEQAETALKHNVYADYESVFPQIQEELISIGECIETVEGDDCVSVHLLEEKCEMLYQFLITSNISLRKKIVSQIKKKLVSLKNEIENNIKNDKLIAVFLPYKASMWDSLESVWMAAKEDEDCEAIVVPIPYYDKLSDGNVSEFHYEIDEYPEYVPVINWEEINIEELHPDVIYFHNPYDNTNTITSVHPMFYAKKLREYTDNLVYIPYFVATNNKVQKHLCVTPGTIYADKVIVQSDEVRKTYVEELALATRDYNNVNMVSLFNNKIIALGSPKYDKVISNKKEQYILPIEWENVIKCDDGHLKKVVLYNTTIEPMLIDSEKMIIKMQSVFNEFRNKKDYVLWWRPHPLLKQSLMSTNLKAFEKYQIIENEYINEGFGIYDDTPDLHRAIALSDAYYGDMSSVVELYRQTNKPIVLQNCDVMGDKGRDGYFMLECIEKYKNEYYATSIRLNGIFSIDREGTVRFVSKIKAELDKSRFLYSDSVTVDDFIVYAPNRADNICVFYPDSKSFKYIKIDSDIFPSNQGKFSKCIHYDGKVFFIPQQIPYIIKLNIETFELEYIDLRVNTGDVFFKKGCCVDNNIVYIPSIINKCYYVLDMDTGRTDKVELDAPIKGVWSIAKYKDDLWMISHPESYILKVDLKTNETMCISQFPQDVDIKDYGFAMSFIKDGFYYACPVKSNSFVRVNCLTGEVEKVVMNDFIENNCEYMYADIVEDKLYFYKYKSDENIFYSNGKHLVLDIENLTTKEQDWKILNRNEYMVDTFKINDTKKLYLYESPNMDIFEIFKLSSIDDLDNRCINYGKRIFEATK